MKNRLKLVLALGAMVALAGVAQADFNVLDKTTWYQNGANGARVTSAGHATVEEQSPAMDANLTFTNIISNASLAPGAADSSTVQDTHRMRIGMLLIKCTPLNVTGADSLGLSRIAVQVRVHLTSAADDSMNTFVIYPYARSDQGAVAAASQVDTVMAGQTFNAVNLAASVNTAQSGETVVAIAMNRIGPGTSALGSLGQRTFAYPNGIALPLSSVFGRDIYSPYTSIRVRNLGGSGAANRSVKITVSMVGSPL